MLNQDNNQHVSAVGIRPNSSILSVLSHLNYKAWYAVAEFVDNSIQSYLTNRAALRKIHGESFKLRVCISLDQQNQILEVSDNAGGIVAADYPRAFRPAEIPLDRSGLSEFGMGMKTAACWFTNSWNIRSKALGENVERLVRFDLDEIVSGRLEQLRVHEAPADPLLHFTVLRLEGLGKKFPINRTQKKLRDHLSSIYRVYLREKEIELYCGEDQLPLQFNDPEVLVAPPFSALADSPIRWHKSIDIDLGNNRRVHGFAALRREASTTHAGFALFRRNRLILGSDDEPYRPAEIFGNPNSFRYQRIFGELHMEGFEVSHTKDGFRWDGLEEEFLERLRDELRADLDLLRQADNFRARPSRTTLQPTLERIGNSLAADMARARVDMLTTRENAEELLSDTFSLLPSEKLIAAETKFNLLVDEQKWSVIVRTSMDPLVNEWLRIGKSDQDQIDGLPIRNILIDVSMAHPFAQHYLGARSENAELFVRIAVALALAAEKSGRAGYPVTLAIYWLNRLLRESILRNVE